MVHLDYRDARPIYCQIADDIRRRIASGILLPGDRLPSVRELAMELAINPNTIQRAYRELEAGGHIATVAGKGCFVCPSIGSKEEHKPLWAALDAAVEQLQAQGLSREDVLQYLRQGGSDHASNA